MRHLIYLTLLVSTSLGAGSIQKWVDEDGNVHYGDTPPVNAKTENVRVQAPPSNPGKSLPRLSTQQDKAGAAGGGTTTAEGGEVPADQAKIACDQATEDLRVITSSSRIQLRAADGSLRYLSTEEIQERKERSEADIERFCQ